MHARRPARRRRPAARLLGRGGRFADPAAAAGDDGARLPRRDEVKRLYAERSGRDLSEIDFYVALGLWKLAIILEGVFARYRAGQYGDAEESREGDVVEQLVEAASEAADRLG